MGSIVTIFPSINQWTIGEPTCWLKTTKEPLVPVRYGSIHDDVSFSDMSMLMRKSIVENLLHRRCRISHDHDNNLLITDAHGNTIEPVDKGFIY